MSYLTLSEPALLERGALNTAKEISGQPELWESTAARFFAGLPAINRFLETALPQSSQIILTGAGTSAFIGLSLEGLFFTRTGKISRALATTQIVSHPEHFFGPGEVPLIVSFARSGRSPESCAALEIADRLCGKCFHLIITCNAQGALAHYNSDNPVHVFVLPPEADDKSLAMTGSYSAMLLTGLLVAFRNDTSFLSAQLGLLVQAGRHFLSPALVARLREIAEKPFRRAVFLGSGPQFGTATEAALKVQELTDGQVICKADSYLGFRHGPKAVIDEETLIVYFFSPLPYVARYEMDLLRDMHTGNTALFQFGVGNSGGDHPGLPETFGTGKGTGGLTEDFLPVCTIIAGQLLGFFRSLHTGLMPDAPSVSGSISRVVQGVHIYPIGS